MKKVVLMFVLIFGLTFTSCQDEPIIEAPQTECARINAYYESLTEGLSVEEASTFIQDWQDALNAAGCPSIGSL